MNRREPQPQFPLLPGSTLGMLGSGQLGRMFAIAARRLGYRVHVFSPHHDTPTGQVADREFQGDYADDEAVAAFARTVDVVSYEFENVPSGTVTAVEACGVPVLPGGNVLYVSQNRVREKSFLQDHDLPVANFAGIGSAEDAKAIPSDSPLFPGVLKTAEFGYDGKGQARVDSPSELLAAWEAFQTQCVLEQLVDFQRELSVVAARGMDGEVACYGPMENLHTRHILDVSLCPADIDAVTSRRAVELATAVMSHLEVVGVLCVEMFHRVDGELLINELAPRPHNSGHLTIDAHRSCQFEQQVRTICGLPLGSAELLQPAAMANLLGDAWCDQDAVAQWDSRPASHVEDPPPTPSRTPRWDKLCEHRDIKLHLYGKAEAKFGRKMGHITVLAESAEQARAKVEQARKSL